MSAGTDEEDVAGGAGVSRLEDAGPDHDAWLCTKITDAVHTAFCSARENNLRPRLRKLETIVSSAVLTAGLDYEAEGPSRWQLHIVVEFGPE